MSTIESKMRMERVKLERAQAGAELLESRGFTCIQSLGNGRFEAYPPWPKADDVVFIRLVEGRIYVYKYYMEMT